MMNLNRSSPNLSLRSFTEHQDAIGTNRVPETIKTELEPDIASPTRV
ncbi:hypothetical protein Hanom_Chr14g01286941 [Helianthus anomalus]